LGSRGPKNEDGSEAGRMKCDCFSHNGFLTERGYAELAQRELELGEVDALPHSSYVDTVGSVSALELERDMYGFVSDAQIDQQYRRFLNGS